MITVTSAKEAWEIVHGFVYSNLFVEDVFFERDETRSKNAGYPVYMLDPDVTDNETAYNTYVCVLNDRLELNLPNGKSINIWCDLF